MVNRKVNYNLVAKLLIGVVICQFFLVVLLMLQNIMFYRANFYNNNYQTQIVNIDNTPKHDKIDINTCSYEALDSLDGIGSVKADKIIAGRPYKDIYQVKKIVGDRTFDKIKNYIKVGGTNE